uniref:Uncharacterized protein n=1 Tax=Mesocestoides corti TaxID=53468 RepID=A0A5K3G368_MESCO
MGDSRSSTPLAQEADSSVDDPHLTDNTTDQQTQRPRSSLNIKIAQILGRLVRIMIRLRQSLNDRLADTSAAIDDCIELEDMLQSAAWELSTAEQDL